MRVVIFLGLILIAIDIIKGEALISDSFTVLVIIIITIMDIIDFLIKKLNGK